MLDTRKYKEKIIQNQLPKYSLPAILTRFAVASIVGLLAIRFMVHADRNTGDMTPPVLLDYLLVMLAFNLLSEAQVVMDHVLEPFLPISKKPRQRILLQFSLNILLTVFVYHFVEYLAYLTHPEEEISEPIFYIAIALGLVFVTLFSSTLSLARLTSKWMNAQHHIHELEQEKLKMDYGLLQDQLNPHFLFNNLSVLKSLIVYDRSAAVKFTENFTDVYRYVLRSKDKLVVSFKEEYDFIDAYIGLHKERLGEGLQASLNVDAAAFDKKIAPMTLQLLVENAVKHNVASKDTPLKVDIYSNNGFVSVENCLQRKESSYSSRIGLGNLVKRYQLLTHQEIMIEDENDKFKVTVPLL
ncbi:MAG: histidine kinase [Cytophagales bacterium]|nr:histidine kinase [Cytophagales bacterium]